MGDASLPPFVVALCFASGLLLVAAGIPMWLRRVPPNRFYGVRFRSTLSDDRIWYDINALCGRNLVVIGAAYVLLLTVGQLFGRASTMPLRLLGATVVLVLGLIANTILLSRAAHRACP